eukprot:m.28290 g.28290  ORF g.28290 m.28290 type:complete len:877 (+) comp8799_c0_seq1:695-3325(+)
MPQQSSNRELTFLERTSVAINEVVFQNFQKLGESVADHPRLFIAVPVFIMICFAAGMATLDIEYNPERLYTPQSSESFDHRDIVEETFGYEDLESDFFATNNGDALNIINKPNILSFLDMYEAIAAANGTFDGEFKDLQSSCRKSDNGNCDQVSVLDFWDYDRSAIQADPNVLDTINAGTTDGLNRPILISNVLGGVSYNANNNVTAAEAFRLRIALVNTPKQHSDGGLEDRASTGYQRFIADVARSGNPWGALRIYTLSEGEQDEEFSAAITDDIVLLIIGYMLLSAYAYFVLSRSSKVHSHGSLALLSVLCVGLSIVASFGLLSLLGVQFSLAVQTLAFLLLGLGVDDTFVLMSTFQRDSWETPTKVRISRALAIGGSSILVTSLSDCIAFISGTYTELPALQAFCLFAAVGVLFDFLLQVTLFIAFMYYGDRREKDGRADMICCTIPSDPNAGCCRKSSEPFDRTKPTQLTKFLTSFARNVLITPAGKAVVLTITLILFASSLYGATQVKSDFDIEWFAPDNSYIQESYDVRDRYFTGRNIPVGFYTGQVDYANLQPRLEELSAELESASFIRLCNNWFTDYQAFISDRALVGGHAPAAQFLPWLREFLNSTQGQEYVDRVAFDPNDNSTITGTEIFCLWKQQDDALSRVDAMEDSRDVARDYPDLDAFAYSFLFLFLDGIKVIREQILINIAMAAVAVLVITILLLANIPASLLVFAMLVLVDVNVLGWLYWYGIDFNSVSAINLVIAVGLAVDSSVHIAHSFLVAKGTKDERAVECVNHIGSSVTNGSISTFLAVLPLAASQSYIFSVFFRCLITIIGFSFFHGVLVLPVVLSLVGPDPYPQDMSFQNAADEVKDNAASKPPKQQRGSVIV